MAARYKFYLKIPSQSNWTLLADEPSGWQEMSEEIIRDSDIHGLIIQIKATLTFTGDGYMFIKGNYDCYGACQEIQIKIDESCGDDGDYEQIVDGVIKMGDVRFPLNTCSCEAPIIDNSYFARIKNNANIEAYPHVDKSKSGFDITAASMNPCNMFDPTTGIYEIGNTRYAYRIFEVIKFLVAFMSDGEVDFASDLFDTGEFSGEFITTGSHLKDADPANYQNPDIGKISWQTAIDEVYKIANVGFVIETGGAKPVLRLENADYFYNANISEVLVFANGVIEKVKTEQLYAYVNFGSEKTIPQTDVPALSFPDEIDFLGWKDESFQLSGQCNVENILDLKGSFIRSSNVIEDIFLGVTSSPNDSYDNDFIFISAEPTGGGNYQAIKYDIFGTGVAPYQYNGNITNYEISLRFLGYIPNSISSYFISGNHSFEALDADVCNSPTVTTIDVDIFIPCTSIISNDGDYDSVNAKYIAPSNGMFNFFGEIDFSWSGGTSPTNPNPSKAYGVFKIYDASDVFSREFIFANATYNTDINSSTVWQLRGTRPIQLSANERVKLYLRLKKGTTFSMSYAINIDCDIAIYYPDRKCRFKCIANGIEQEFKTEDVKIIQWKFDYPIPNNKWKNIKANPKDKLAFNIDGIFNYEPWIENIQRSNKDSIATITLIGKQIKSC